MYLLHQQCGAFQNESERTPSPTPNPSSGIGCLTLACWLPGYPFPHAVVNSDIENDIEDTRRCGLDHCFGLWWDKACFVCFLLKCSQHLPLCNLYDGGKNVNRSFPNESAVLDVALGLGDWLAFFIQILLSFSLKHSCLSGHKEGSKPCQAIRKRGTGLTRAPGWRFKFMDSLLIQSSSLLWHQKLKPMLCSA